MILNVQIPGNYDGSMSFFLAKIAPEMVAFWKL
jgi:hypothetical protein